MLLWLGPLAVLVALLLSVLPVFVLFCCLFPEILLHGGVTYIVKCWAFAHFMKKSKVCPVHKTSQNRINTDGIGMCFVKNVANP